MTGDETAAALARCERQLRTILACVPDAMIVFDEDGVISSFSAAAERMFGYGEDEVVGRHLGMLIPSVEPGSKVPDGRVFIETGVELVVGDGESRPKEAMRKNGERFPAELTAGEASIAGDRIFTGFIRDLTVCQEGERRVQELQSELIHVSRLSAMGTMASTLAHEINQPLTAIANYLEAARAMVGDCDHPATADVAEAIERAAAQSLRAGAIVRRVRAFVEGGDTGFRVETLDAVIDEATSLGLLGAHEAGITVTLAAAGHERVVIDRIQIQQVLVNLIRNAIQSMASSPRKELTVATAPGPDGWVRVTVADTGHGIDRAVRDRLFEAFATTKEDGMGLGLSICRTIVESHGGRIWADGRADGGTAFHFSIPLAADGDD